MTINKKSAQFLAGKEAGKAAFDKGITQMMQDPALMAQTKGTKVGANLDWMHGWAQGNQEAIFAAPLT